jgi:hypothetical protein
MPRRPRHLLPTFLTIGLLAGCPTGPGDGGPGGTTATGTNPCAGIAEWYRDQDNDGYGTSSIVSDDCEAPLGYVEADGDCNDDNRLINPGMVELCDPLDADEDCSGAADNDDPTATGTVEAWVDADMDGFGSEGGTSQYCDVPPTAAQNNIDCDDNEAGAWPGSAFEESVLDCMKDTDGDGWGDINTSGDVLPGTDCADNDPGAYPFALEVWADGVDQDCDGADDFALFEGFETGVIEVANWAAAAGSSIETSEAAAGFNSLLLSGGDSARSVSADSNLCVDLIYSVRVKRGLNITPAATDRLTMQYRTSAGLFVTFDAVVGNGAADSVFVAYTGELTNVDAYHPDFAIRFASVGLSDFLIDEIFVGCPGDDLDGDGFAGLLDCDDTNDQHWADCGVCVDNDGDGYGDGCDIGGDCDDNDPVASPTGPDAPGDGIDSNCDGWDGVVLLETFELGLASSSVWDSLTGDANVSNFDAVAASFSLELGTAGDATTRVFDATLCPTVTWYYKGRRGPDAPVATDSLRVEYWDGAAWVTTDTWYGSDFNDAFMTERTGEITDSAIISNTAQVRFVSDSPSVASFYVDDVLVGCPVDTDGDGRGSVVDCDDTDPSHWSDCNICIDNDGDDYGTYCDLGPDCDDSDAATNPWGIEVPNDGLDQNCDSLDTDGLIDNFETGDTDPSVWASLSGTMDVVDGLAGAGRHSLALRGDGAMAETFTIDATRCAALAYRWAVQRGPETPDIGVTVSLQMWDGVDYATVDTLGGTGVDDTEFDYRLGVVTNPTHLRADLSARLEVSGGVPGQDVFYIDDFVVACGDADRDGDGVPPPIDCDDTDRSSWSDCWSCVDYDNDGYGQTCDDSPSDCDDGNPLINPGAVDVVVDGIDWNCDGLDASLIDHNFEIGSIDPTVWDYITGDAGYTNAYASSGSWSLNMGGEGGNAETVTHDTSGCASGIAWSFMGKRGPETPDNNDDVLIEYKQSDGTWALVYLWEGEGVTDTDFSPYSGSVLSGTVTHSSFRLRFTSNGSGANFDDFFLDDLVVECAP